jgi:hypothetical protein
MDIRMKTNLNRWHDVDGVYTRDTWTIPDEGTEIWCTGWKRGQTIKPYGDGCHVLLGLTVYHCDELMGILDRWEADGATWGVEGVKMYREQRKGGYWERVAV